MRGDVPVYGKAQAGHILSHTHVSPIPLVPSICPSPPLILCVISHPHLSLFPTLSPSLAPFAPCLSQGKAAACVQTSNVLLDNTGLPARYRARDNPLCFPKP
jgi:hypothetical protein